MNPSIKVLEPPVTTRVKVKKDGLPAHEGKPTTRNSPVCEGSCATIHLVVRDQIESCGVFTHVRLDKAEQ